MVLLLERVADLSVIISIQLKVDSKHPAVSFV
jgi:hypothetical protein